MCTYIGVFLFVCGLVVGRGGISSGLVALVVTIRLGSDSGNDGEENDSDLKYKINIINILNS